MIAVSAERVARVMMVFFLLGLSIFMMRMLMSVNQSEILNVM